MGFFFLDMKQISRQLTAEFVSCFLVCFLMFVCLFGFGLLPFFFFPPGIFFFFPQQRASTSGRVLRQKGNLRIVKAGEKRALFEDCCSLLKKINLQKKPKKPKPTKNTQPKTKLPDRSFGFVGLLGAAAQRRREGGSPAAGAFSPPPRALPCAEGRAAPGKGSVDAHTEGHERGGGGGGWCPTTCHVLHDAGGWSQPVLGDAAASRPAAGTCSGLEPHSSPLRFPGAAGRAIPGFFSSRRNPKSPFPPPPKTAAGPRGGRGTPRTAPRRSAGPGRVTCRRL